MEHSRIPSLSLISSSLPAAPISSAPSYRPNKSPFRYLDFQYPADKSPAQRERSLSPRPSPSTRPSTSTPPISSSSAFLRQTPAQRSPPRTLRVIGCVKPWIPIIAYAFTSLAFVVAFACYKTELFASLDELSHWLAAQQLYGQATLFFLIFLTTIPPFPLYSTLIILSGYTFGAWEGALISYAAALSGAVIVFIVSRTILHDCISQWLSKATTMNRVVRAIEKRPKLLFLIRLAPYPYNVMNCLLAAAPSLSFTTYFTCTALSLFKVILHTSLGASIHSFADYHLSPDHPTSDADEAAHMWTIFGIVLCVVIFVYISIIARRAVDELDDAPLQEEEVIGLLSPADDLESGLVTASTVPMSESPFRSLFPQAGETLRRD